MFQNWHRGYYSSVWIPRICECRRLACCTSQRRVRETQFSIRFRAKRDNAKLRGSGGGKAQRNGPPHPRCLGKDNPVEGLNGDDCFQADETVVDMQQAQSPISMQ